MSLKLEQNVRLSSIYRCKMKHRKWTPGSRDKSMATMPCLKITFLSMNQAFHRVKKPKWPLKSQTPCPLLHGERSSRTKGVSSLIGVVRIWDIKIGVVKMTGSKWLKEWGVETLVYQVYIVLEVSRAWIVFIVLTVLAVEEDEDGREKVVPEVSEVVLWIIYKWRVVKVINGKLSWIPSIIIKEGVANNWIVNILIIKIIGEVKKDWTLMWGIKDRIKKDQTGVIDLKGVGVVGVGGGEEIGMKIEMMKDLERIQGGSIETLKDLIKMYRDLKELMNQIE